MQATIEAHCDFELGTPVEIPVPGGNSTFGVVRWIGNIPQIKDRIIVGLELVRKGIIL